MNRTVGIIATIVGALCLVFFALWTFPQWSVHNAKMSGKAAIQRAEEQKKVLVEDAKARRLAAEEDAKAEVIRAKGMAEAMQIENGQLTPVYNQYLFIRTLEELSEHGDLPQIIYVPSNGMLPVMDLNK